MATRSPPLPSGTGSQVPKGDSVKPRPGTADKPAGKPALKGPLDRPEKS